MYKIQRDPVPMELWGKDHWSTFAYLETVCVDYKGAIDKRRMRCSTRRHPGWALSSSILDTEYPTRLRGKVELSDHDDYDCIEDMEAAGLLKWIGTSTHPGIVTLTNKGKQLAGRLRAHKMNGGMFGNFEAGSV